MEVSSRRLEGRHVVVTGAGTGIGRSIALRLASEGAQLTLMARDVARLSETAELVRHAEARARSAHGPVALLSPQQSSPQQSSPRQQSSLQQTSSLQQPNSLQQPSSLEKPSSHEKTVTVSTLACDIRDRTQVDRRFAEAREKHGPIFALVANSGIGGPNAPGGTDRFDDLVATNLVGTYSCLRAAEAHLASGPGARHIVVIASILARIGVGNYTGYCASKAGLMGLVRALAAELATRDIQVNAVCPGWVDTAMAREGLEGMSRGMNVSIDEAKRIAMSAVPMGRMSAPEDVAGLVAWLVSPDARGVTGQGLDMNGGAFMI